MAVAVRRGTAEPLRSESTEKMLTRVRTSAIHTVAHIVGSIGVCFMRIGWHNLAVRCLKRALEGHQRVKEPEGEAANLANLGVALHCRGNLDRAFDAYQQAIGVYEAVDDQRGRANCLVNLGTLYVDRQDRVEALENYKRAALIYEQLGRHKTADRVRREISKVDGRHKLDTT